MNEPVKTISRAELYERLWKTPIVQLAKELGFSYAELVDISQRLNVPRPTPGHWYRVGHGQAHEQLPLPHAGPGVPIQIALGRRLHEETVEQSEDPKATAESAEPVGCRSVEKVGSATGTRQEEPVHPVIAPVAEGSEIPMAAPVAAVVKEKTPTAAISSAPPERPEGRVVTYSRQELYDAIWSTPCLKLAASLGISDVALAKTCKRLGIPRPSLGYWARVAVGEKVPKTRMPPPQAGQDRVVTFDVAANLERRKEWKETAPSQKDVEHLAVELGLPDSQSPLHPLAEKHQRALEKAKAGDDGFVRISRKDCFECSVAQGSCLRLCRVLHALIVEIEARGFKFRAGANDYDVLSVVKGADSVRIRCSEGKEEVEREPTEQDKRKPSWTWQLKRTEPTGKFSFEVLAPGLRGRHTWSESDARSIEDVLGVVVEKVEMTFRWFEEERQRETERARQRQEEAKREVERRARDAELEQQRERERAEREKTKRHEVKLEEIAQARRDNLGIAAQQWIEAQGMSAFIEVCEDRWRRAGGGELTNQQSEWLTWARAEASKFGPFAKGYPDPASDGRLENGNVPLGGPYPQVRVLDEEPPEEVAPAEAKSVYVEQPRPPEQFPFWFLHRGR